MQAEQKNAVLAASTQRAYEADAALLDSFETSVWRYRPDMSLNQPGENITGMAVFNASLAEKRIELTKELMPAVIALRSSGRVPPQHAALPVLLSDNQTCSSRS